MHDICVSCAVYAVGLYVDPHAAKKLLDGKVSAGASALDQGIFDGGQPDAELMLLATASPMPTQLLTADIIQANDVEKSLRMVISFGGVNQKNFWSALQERLEPAMKQV